ncbi:MAG: hypothetical protein IKW81_12420 [Pseudobutyrivibrio sp.]|nr:hypothetical protein [Pseudobutyrivibrio sp.]
MYHYVEDKKFLHKSYSFSADIVNQLVQHLKHFDIETQMSLVGSGNRNMVTQNGNGPIDFDFNLIIEYAPDIRDCRYIKDTVMLAFNDVLDNKKLPNCKDSTSVITTREFHFTEGNQTGFSIDICIVYLDEDDNWYRLIHQKTGNVNFDRYYWNQGPNTREVWEREDFLKDNNYWNEVRDTYLKKKNMYLCRHDNWHHSFNCYIEAINEVYSKVAGGTDKRNINGWYTLW